MTGLARARDVLARLGPFARRRGVLSVARSCGRRGAQYVAVRSRLGRRPPGTFGFDGRELEYAHHVYNHTWLNERAVEVALARDVVREHATARVLELGNVLSHDGPVSHVVVDKYENAQAVRNVEVSDLRLDDTYDLIVSVPTLEHVGPDEAEQDPEKPGKAIDRLKAHLAPGGLLWVTLPVGYNIGLDRLLYTAHGLVVAGYTRSAA